ncbi:MAG: hypothetical protein ACREPW_10635 [Candidatus Binataceae bacterium]
MRARIAAPAATSERAARDRGGLRYAPQAIPWLGRAGDRAGYGFTSSTSFANPEGKLACGFADTFAGIALSA